MCLICFFHKFLLTQAGINHCHLHPLKASNSRLLVDEDDLKSVANEKN